MQDLEHLDRLSKAFTEEQARAILSVQEAVLGEPLSKAEFETRLELLDQKLTARVGQLEQKIDTALSVSLQKIELAAKNMELSASNRDRNVLIGILVTALGVVGTAVTLMSRAGMFS